MAAVSRSGISIVTTNSSSSGLVQLARSSNNAPAPNETESTLLAASNNKLRSDAMAQPSRPIADEAMNRPSSTSTGSDGNHGTSTIRFSTPELNELTSNPLLDSILRPNKDGRVKNPVPSKLKGKTDTKKGNFSVMHMGMTPGKKNDVGKDAAAERDAAARRTSENTASRAKAARHEKYIPPRRRGLEAEGTGAATIKIGSPFAPSRDEHKQRTRPLAPDETKFEQARLLTLLRSINPITVVDQICKAVAYFGGIPGAPPPEDGIFPESASTKETGALFIGWLAEIFPDLASQSGHAMHDTPGSGQNRLSIGAPMQMPPNNGVPNPSNGFGYGQAVSAPAWGVSPALHTTNSPGASITPEAGQSSNAGPAQNNQPEQPRQETPPRQPPPEAPPPSLSTSKRGRGRPKGSRNKGKSDAQNAVETAASGGPTGPDSASQNRPLVLEQSHDSSLAVEAPGKGAKSGAAQSQSESVQPSKTKQATRYTEPPWRVNVQKTQAEPAPAALPPTVEELSPEERAVLEAFRLQDVSNAGKASPLDSVAVQDATGAGLKRKRPTPKPKSIAGPLNQPSEQTQPIPHMSVSSNAAPISATGVTLNWSAVDNSTPSVPAAKRQRQRKPKAPGGNEPPQSQTTSVTSNTTPPVVAHAVPDSTSTSQQIPPYRPSAEGLEAHYEKFASRPQQVAQQNNASHTPSIAQQQQQQLRQQQKPTAVAPQQKHAPAPPQQQRPTVQMQQQKSQQDSQRDNQKATQGSAARPPSTGFYNQRGHGSFGQQYPSNQTSQLYGAHQPSQLGSGNNSTKSFRPTNAHNLGQNSPQFSQGEAYRTASPHTVSQASPTFTQADNSFRSANSHSIPQSSPAYAQAEKIYRAANAQPITQPSSSYPRSHNQSQQSHQGNYSHFTENPYADLPTLDTLGHGATAGHPAVNLNSGSFVQGVSSAMSASSRASTSSLFGTTSPNIFDSVGSGDQQQKQQLLRAAAASRPQGSGSVYGTSSNLNSNFDSSASDQELRDRLMRNIGRR